jgi:hypothetical protein
MVGFWDEVLIREARIVDNDEFIDRCRSLAATRSPQGRLPSGNLARNSSKHYLFVLALDDGCELRIVFAEASAG